MSTKPLGISTAGALQRGLTLVELIFFIVIVSVALTGVLTVLNVTTARSSDPLVRKQGLAIAEAVLEEVRLQSFTWCDPDDPNAATAASAANCTGGAAGVNDQAATAPGTAATAPGTAAETRGHATTPFDNVRDYNGAVITTSLAGVAFPAGYTANVVVIPGALNGIGVVDPNDSLLIRVTVTFGGENLVLEGYRTRHAPTFLP